jgi:hypothetical protein
MNHLTINDMLLAVGLDPDIMHRKLFSEVQVVMAGLVMKNLMLPNVKQDNTFFVSFSLNRDFLKSIAGKRFATEEVDSNFIFGKNVSSPMLLQGNTELPASPKQSKVTEVVQPAAANRDLVNTECAVVITEIANESMMQPSETVTAAVEDIGQTVNATEFAVTESSEVNTAFFEEVLMNTEPEAVVEIPAMQSDVVDSMATIQQMDIDLTNLGFLDDSENVVSVTASASSTAWISDSEEASNDISLPAISDGALIVPSEDALEDPFVLRDAIAVPEVAAPEAAAPVRTRGRPRKTKTPKVESSVRRSTRQHNDGVHYELPNLPSRRRASSVPRATTPATLQISEMQRMGIEQCLIDPAELTEERLLQDRQA